MDNYTCPQGVAADFGGVAGLPTRVDEVTGIMYDFNDGLRIATPEVDAVWKLVIAHAESGDVLINSLMPSGSNYVFPFKYYIPLRVTMTSPRGTFQHTLSLKNQVVAFKMCQRTLGDPIAFFSYIPEFIKLHGCKAIVYAPTRIAELFLTSYSDIEFRPLTEEDTTLPYATYYLGLFYGKHEDTRFYQPYDFRLFGLHEQAKHILGLDESLVAEAPAVNIKKCKHHGKYVCISFTGSKANKVWWNPTGWKEVIEHLYALGYKVYCIDGASVMGTFPYTIHIPNGVEDYTGMHPLQNRLDMLYNADMFICMASGLAWLAWLARTPTIMVSGFSLPYAEFHTPYRVINTMADCIGCWNDTRIAFDRHDFIWCPRIDAKIREIKVKMRNETTVELWEEYEQQIAILEQGRFGCTKAITGAMVIAKINQVIKDKAKRS